MSARRLVAALVAVILIAAGTGVWIGYFCIPTGSSESTRDAMTWQAREQALVDRIGGLEADRQRLEAALSRAMSRIEELGDRLAMGDGASEASSPPGDETAVETDEVDPTPSPGGVNWKNLSSLFNKHADLIARVCDLEKENKDISKILSPEELAALRETQAEWVKAASQAHVLSKYPVLDSDMLPDFVKASLGALLGLSEDQMEAIVAESMGVPLSREALESATPLEAYAERLDLIDRMERVLPEVLDDAQLETWQRVDERVMSLFRGEPKVTRVGFDCDKQNVLDMVTRAWREHYGFPETMHSELDAIATDYIERARGVFQRYGDPRGHLTNLERPVRESLEIDLMALQLEVERGLLEQLTPEQVKGLVGQTPWLVQFELSTAVTLRTGDSVGF